MTVKFNNDQSRQKCRDTRLESFDKDQCCETPEPFETTEGNIVCKRCGTCTEIIINDQDRRAYTIDEINARRRTEVIMRPYGARTHVGMNPIDTMGRALSPKKAAMFARLAKINRSLFSTEERNFWEANPRMKSLSTSLSIPFHVESTAWKIYIESVRHKLTMGRSIDAFVRASMYVAIRVHDFPRLLDEMIPPENDGNEKRKLYKAIRLIVSVVLPLLGLKYSPVSIRSIIYRTGQKIGIPIYIQQDAINLIKIASKKGVKITGKDPKGMAAAALYVVTKGTKFHKTQVDIASAARVTEVTLRTRARQIIDVLNDGKI